MTLTQPSSSEHNTSDEIRCPYCDSPLPAYATFCGACGKRVEPGANPEIKQEKRPSTSGESSTERYRITALVGRRPHIQLYLAMDTLFRRPVTLCDITVSSLSEEAQTQAFRAAQHECDVLRRQRIPGLTPVIDVRSSDGHILLVGGWPFPLHEANGTPIHTHTLEDLLQSGIGLPDEQVAFTWIHSLCTVVGQLHHASLLVGTLDPGSVVVSTASYTGQPALMVSWSPQEVRTLLPQVSASQDASRFSAPEVLYGQVEPRSDLYSLGALLYLLLTGMTPQEQSSSNRDRAMGQHLRERTPRLSKGSEELVLRALSSNPSERFQNADEMNEALQQQLTSIAARKRGRAARSHLSATGESEEVQDNTSDTGGATVSVVPIRAQLARWHLSRQDTQDMTNDVQIISAQMAALQSAPLLPLPSEQTSKMDTTVETIEADHTAHFTEDDHRQPLPDAQEQNGNVLVEDMPTMHIPPTSAPAPETPRPANESLQEMYADNASRALPSSTGRSPSLRQRITGIIPAFPKRTQPRIPATQADLDASSKPAVLAWLQRLFVGEQQQRTTAAALIETPVRVQPNQGYNIRIHLMGRETPSVPKGAKKGAQPVGLSALNRDEIVHIEVRSAIYQNYAYIVQRADVQIPGEGFAAEVTIPMQPLSGGQNGRRERLHIFFMDELRQPLYERPFVLEVFVSHLVQAGKEGHNVMSIPL